MSATATMDAPAQQPAAPGTLVIPKGCKPSKACGTDRTRPMLCHAYLRKHDDAMWLCMTDSFIAVALRVETDAIEGFVPIGVLKLMETGKEGVQVSPTTWKVTVPDGTLTFDCADPRVAKFPDFENLGVWDRQESNAVDAIGMNGDMMARISAELGARNGLRVDFLGPLRPLRVTPLGFDVGVALQMPIRLDA